MTDDNGSLLKVEEKLEKLNSGDYAIIFADSLRPDAIGEYEEKGLFRTLQFLLNIPDGASKNKIIERAFERRRRR